MLALTGAAGCGGSHVSGIAAKPPSQIIAAAQTAAEAATSVHVAGSINATGGAESFDLHLLASGGARGRVTQGGATFELRDAGPVVYLRGSEAFYKRIGGAAAARLLKGRWIKALARDPKLAPLKHLVDLHSLISSALQGHAGLKSGGTSIVRGAPAVAVRDDSLGETVYVASKGTPYPLQITKTGAGGGRISFDGWNAPVDIPTPEGAIDIATLQAQR